MKPSNFLAVTAEIECECELCRLPINRGEECFLKQEVISDGIGEPFLDYTAFCKTCTAYMETFNLFSCERRDVEAFAIISDCELCQKHHACNIPSYEIFTCEFIRNKYKMGN